MSHNHTNTPPAEDAKNVSPDTALDSRFDSALHQHFQSLAEPDDEGFSQRVTAVLPAHAARRPIRWRAWAQTAQWSAISLAACAVAGLMSVGEGRVEAAHQTAAYILIGLLVFWSIPSRWSRP